MIFVVGALLPGMVLHAQFNPPLIEYQTPMRELDVLVDYRLDDMDPGDGANDDEIFTGTGLWSKSLPLTAGPASARATTNSNIGRFSVVGTSRVSATLDDIVYSGSAGALSSVSLAFTVPVDTEFVLNANFEFLDEVATGWSRGQVLMSGMDGQGIFQHEVDSEDPSTWNILFSDSMTAGNQGIFVILIHAQRGRQPDIGDDETGTAIGLLEFALDFGDRDGDGLLDTWEEEDQIDLGDGVVIDLSEYDPDPDKKDLFVEIDVAHVVPGIDIETDVIPMVVDSFADAPAELVNNPDGSDGITLHVFVDEMLPAEHAILVDDGASLPPEYYDVKSNFQATPAIRAQPLWDAGPLKEAWQAVFRYSLWLDRLQEPFPDDFTCMNPTPCDGGDFFQIGGKAESIPGNDFVVAAGHMHCRKTNSPTATIEDSKAGMAGVFMHELGHTLGLAHGGGQDLGTAYKPNHISVMNYFLASPWTAITAQGTTGRDAWTLDYSRQTLTPVNEEALLEEEGLNGPLTCRQGNPPTLRPCRILFNSAPVADPEEDTEALITIGHPFPDHIDWNNDGTISSGPLMPTVDTTRVVAASRCSGAVRPVVLEQFESYTDWDVLALEAPIDDPLRAQHRAGTTPPGLVEMNQFEYFSILEADWFDQTAPPAWFFLDGFDN